MATELPPIAQSENITDLIAGWRATGRQYARAALRSDHDDDPQQAMYEASMAAMFFAVAMDASHFGDLPALLPDIEYEDDSPSEVSSQVDG